MSTEEHNKTVIKFGDYLDSMNFFIRLSGIDKSMDLVDNKYFEIKSYVVSDQSNSREREPVGDEIKLGLCPDE